jgi:hypothetical protein
VTGALCHVCGCLLDPWLAENGYPVHIGCIGKLSVQERARARRKGKQK